MRKEFLSAECHATQAILGKGSTQKENSPFSKHAINRALGTKTSVKPLPRTQLGIVPEGPSNPACVSF